LIIPLEIAWNERIEINPQKHIAIKQRQSHKKGTEYKMERE